MLVLFRLTASQSLSRFLLGIELARDDKTTWPAPCRCDIVEISPNEYGPGKAVTWWDMIRDASQAYTTWSRRFAYRTLPTLGSYQWAPKIKFLLAIQMQNVTSKTFYVGRRAFVSIGL
ncbi:hypothetical protein BDR05DRAFT_988045, partial [Suillus weaverae]